MKHIHRPGRAARLTMLALAGLTLAAGWGLNARADDAGAIERTGTDSAAGAEIYTHICQGCHMPQGEGAAGAGHYPKLSGDPALVSWQYVALTVINGKNGMPAFGAIGDHSFFGAPHLSDAQIAEVVNYVRSHFGNHWKNKTTTAQVASLPHPQ